MKKLMLFILVVSSQFGKAQFQQVGGFLTAMSNTGFLTVESGFTLNELLRFNTGYGAGLHYDSRINPRVMVRTGILYNRYLIQNTNVSSFTSLPIRITVNSKYQEWGFPIHLKMAQSNSPYYVVMGFTMYYYRHSALWKDEVSKTKYIAGYGFTPIVSAGFTTPFGESLDLYAEPYTTALFGGQYKNIRTVLNIGIKFGLIKTLPSK